MEKEKTNIQEKLMLIQKELKAPKNQRNNFGNYNYRNCEDILEAVKPLCIKNNSVLKVSDEIELLGDRFYIKATAILIDTESNEVIINSAYAREEETKKGMDGSQITGTASSYARKYALNGLFCIDDTKDADTDEYSKTTKKEENKKEPRATESQIKIIKEKLTEEQIKKALEMVKREKLEDMKVQEASSLIAKIGGDK